MEEKSRASFREVGRLEVSNTASIVISETYKEGKLVGYNINKWIETEHFTGFTKGLLIPKDLLPSFLALFPRQKLQPVGITRKTPPKQPKRNTPKGEL